MAERQYIGARYVPVFANPIEWNPNQAYEPLTIVTYLQSSYTSRKQTSPGIAPTNTEYWALTGNYNAQVEEYRQQVEQYQAETTQTISKISSAISSKPPFKLNNFIMVGDSFAQGYAPNGNVPSWAYWIKEWAAARYGTVTWHMFAEGGSGFMVKGQNGNTLSEQIVNGATPMTVDERNAVETVLVMGGINDYLNKKVIDYSTVVSACKTYFPNAHVVLMYSSVLTAAVLDYCAALRVPSSDPNVTILTDSATWLYANPTFNSGDFLHPSQAGQLMMGECIWNAHLGVANNHSYSTVEVYQGDGFNVASNYSRMGDTFNIWLKGTVTVSSSTTITIAEEDTLPIYLRNGVADVCFPIWTSAGVGLFYSNVTSLQILLPTGTSGDVTINSRFSSGIINMP